VQSWGGEVRLLPALPKAWPRGELRGVRVHGGIELDIAWDQGRPTRLQLRGRPMQEVTLRHGERLIPLKLDAAGRGSLARIG